MQSVFIQRASELSEDVKSAVERVLGRRIEPEEEITIVAAPLRQVPPLENRVAIARRLEALLDRRAEKVKDVPGEELDAAIEHVRHSRG